MQRQIVWNDSPINSWADFHKSIKRPDKELLERLEDFGDNNVLISGCQRSGTTALTHLINRMPTLNDYAFGADSELDGALLLAGSVARFTTGRHCFQTTYLNDRYPEYLRHDSFRLIWVLREPRSVVYSMLHNWSRGALNRLYEACGRHRLEKVQRSEPTLLEGWFGLARIDKACASYIAKTEQAFVLHRELKDRMLIVDYDELVANPVTAARHICEFAEVPFDESRVHLHGRSSRRGDRLAPNEAARVDESCLAVYGSALTLRSRWGLQNA